MTIRTASQSFSLLVWVVLITTTTHIACITNFEADEVELQSPTTSSTSTDSTSNTTPSTSTGSTTSNATSTNTTSSTSNTTSSTSTGSTGSTTPTCEDTEILCNEDCVPKDTVDHCGGCTPCIAPPNAKAYACSEGACIFTCRDGFADRDHDVNLPPSEDSNGCEFSCTPTSYSASLFTSSTQEPKSWLSLSLTPKRPNTPPSALLSWYDRFPPAGQEVFPEETPSSIHAPPTIASWNILSKTITPLTFTPALSNARSIDLVSVLSNDPEDTRLRGDLVVLPTLADECAPETPIEVIHFDNQGNWRTESTTHLARSTLTGFPDYTAQSAFITRISDTATIVSAAIQNEDDGTSCAAQLDVPNTTDTALWTFPRAYPLDQERTRFKTPSFVTRYLYDNTETPEGPAKPYKNTILYSTSAAAKDPTNPDNTFVDTLTTWTAIRNADPTSDALPNAYYEVGWRFLPNGLWGEEYPRRVWNDSTLIGPSSPDSIVPITENRQAPQPQVSVNTLLEQPETDNPETSIDDTKAVNFILTYFETPTTLQILWLSYENGYHFAGAEKITVTVDSPALSHTLRTAPAFDHPTRPEEPYGAWLTFADETKSLHVLHISGEPAEPTFLTGLDAFSVAPPQSNRRPFAPLDLDSTPSHTALGWIDNDFFVNLLLLDKDGQAACAPNL